MDIVRVQTLLHQSGVSVSLTKQLTLGNVVDGVFRGLAGHNREPVVVKFGDTEKGATEIRKNVVGYAEIVEMGIEWLIPDRRDLIILDGAIVLILSDCGDDFYSAVKKHSQPASLYRLLVNQLPKLYKDTLRATEVSSGVGRTLQKLLNRAYLVDTPWLVPQDILHLIDQWNVSKLTSKYHSFSTFDFTPEDVFVSENGIKYADPKFPQVGVPIVDLACFSGVALAHELPAAHEEYESFRSLAVGEVADLFSLSHDTASQYFEVGRAIQLGFSSRQRLKEGKLNVAENMLKDGFERIRMYCS